MDPLRGWRSHRQATFEKIHVRSRLWSALHQLLRRRPIYRGEKTSYVDRRFYCMDGSAQQRSEETLQTSIYFWDKRTSARSSRHSR